MFKCFHCIVGNLCWECDYNFEYLGYEGEGIIHILHCDNCDAEVEVKVSLKEEENGNNK